MPFVAVAEAYALRSLREPGLRMSEIREAAAAVRDAFDTPYGLVSCRIATDGVNIFVEHGLGDLRRARDGQAPIREVVADYLRYLSWNADDEFSVSPQLRQYPQAVPVVIDPKFGHGLPVIDNREAILAAIDRPHLALRSAQTALARAPQWPAGVAVLRQLLSFTYSDPDPSSRSALERRQAAYSDVVPVYAALGRGHGAYFESRLKVALDQR